MKPAKEKLSKKRKIKLFGIIISIIFGCFTTFSLCAVLQNVFNITFVVSFAITLGLQIAFTLLMFLHKTSRCVVLLMVPQLSTKQGRSAIVAYAFYIALTGPSVNLLKNVEILSDCMMCAQVRL